MTLPPMAVWNTRTQTLSVSGSTASAPNDSSFATIVNSAGYTFDPTTGNSAVMTFNATRTRFVRLTFTANTAWPAGQLSELEIYRS
jgi:hypothetical protein